MREFIRSLDLPEADKERLLQLTPGLYLGLAPELARRAR
jgi:adenylosuccinate lyase